MESLFIYLILAYLIGSLPFAVIVSKAFGLADPRSFGSGNPGATNVLRTGNKAAAVLTLLGDAAKGWLAMFVAAKVGADSTATALAGLAAFIGHLFPIFLKFRGGKGVATYLGTLLVLDWRLGLAACATWAMTAGVTRISSLSGLVAVALTNLWVVVLQDSAMLSLSLALSVLIYWKHWPNIQRIAAGTEPRIGAKK